MIRHADGRVDCARLLERAYRCALLLQVACEDHARAPQIQALDAAALAGDIVEMLDEARAALVRESRRATS